MLRQLKHYWIVFYRNVTFANKPVQMNDSAKENSSNITRLKWTTFPSSCLSFFHVCDWTISNYMVPQKIWFQQDTFKVNVCMTKPLFLPRAQSNELIQMTWFSKRYGLNRANLKWTTFHWTTTQNERHLKPHFEPSVSLHQGRTTSCDPIFLVGGCEFIGDFRHTGKSASCHKSGFFCGSRSLKIAGQA